MRVFVAGATGVIGRPLVRQLIEAGHEVVGSTRSEAKAEELRRAGVEPAVCDAFDAERFGAAIRSARPDVVIDELTDLPRDYDTRHYERTVGGTNRLRSEANATLVAAAREAGARRVIAQSIAFFYAPEGGPVNTEEAPVMSEGPPTLLHGVEVTRELERRVTGTDGIDGVVLRYGMFYGPGTYYARDGSLCAEIARRRFPIVGRGDATFSFVHVEDAAGATVAALDRGSGIYNVVDDDPAPLREWLPVYAEAIGAKPPRRVPVFLARLIGGPVAAFAATKTRGASNEKARRELGWAPRYPSWREGFAAALG